MKVTDKKFRLYTHTWMQVDLEVPNTTSYYRVTVQLTAPQNREYLALKKKNELSATEYALKCCNVMGRLTKVGIVIPNPIHSVKHKVVVDFNDVNSQCKKNEGLFWKDGKWYAVNLKTQKTRPLQSIK